MCIDVNGLYIIAHSFIYRQAQMLVEGGIGLQSHSHVACIYGEDRGGGEAGGGGELYLGVIGPALGV